MGAPTQVPGHIPPVMNWQVPRRGRALGPAPEVRLLPGASPTLGRPQLLTPDQGVNVSGAASGSPAAAETPASTAEGAVVSPDASAHAAPRCYRCGPLCSVM